jgi:coenzyme F420-reducing hydrogenase alpha subunit
MLHAPDFLGYESAIAMAREHRAEVERGLQLKKAGNEIVALVAGREVHPCAGLPECMHRGLSHSGEEGVNQTSYEELNGAHGPIVYQSLALLGLG